MSKKRPPRFRDIWVNQTELGQHFGLINRFLRELGSSLRLGEEEIIPEERME